MDKTPLGLTTRLPTPFLDQCGIDFEQPRSPRLLFHLTSEIDPITLTRAWIDPDPGPSQAPDEAACWRSILQNIGEVLNPEMSALR